MVYFHGGGFIAGNLDTEDAQCRIFAAKTPCVVVSVAYPLSPPALLDDIIDASMKSVVWVSLSFSLSDSPLAFPPSPENQPGQN
jgi:acetyl esterase